MSCYSDYSPTKDGGDETVHLAGLDRTPADQLGHFSFSVGCFSNFVFSSMLCKRRDVSLVGVPGAKIDCFILSHYHFPCCS